MHSLSDIRPARRMDSARPIPPPSSIEVPRAAPFRSMAKVSMSRREVGSLASVLSAEEHSLSGAAGRIGGVSATGDSDSVDVSIPSERKSFPARTLRRHADRNRATRMFSKQTFRERCASRWFSFVAPLSFFSQPTLKRRLLPVLGAFFAIGIVWFGYALYRQGVDMKGRVLGVSTTGYEELSKAVDTASLRDFESSNRLFQNAFVSFSEASRLFDEWNGTLVEATRFLPVLSQVSSGKNLVDAARDIAAAGEKISTVGGSISSFGNLLDSQHRSFLDVFREARGSVEEAEQLLSSASARIDRVSIDDIPKDKRETFLQLKRRLPEALSGMRLFLEHGDIFADILGGNGPRKFLFLFQNNQEMRPTGGFIGSYAFLDINDGRVRKFFVDGIFNPDGQLHEDIVPPEPIQKISAGWSLHDSNWFPDFRLSAEKAIFFYEKTGGPTVDGVITLTPEILRRFLELTGPIEMKQYGVTIDESNFLERIQYQVEVAYDREENKPKQILADLAPILLERIFGDQAAPGTFGGALAVIESGLSEKHILFYSRNTGMERLIRDAGWSGEVLDSSRDYASVIHTNINGYKTDGVIDETISHRAEIQDDGSVIDTIAIRRVHRGGDTGHEWWDKVNADYMRVLVPLGSTLLSAKGYTRETVSAPLDYTALGFSRDPDVDREERGMRIDPESGTRISEDAGKTVFGNWVYVSPGEAVEVVYTYRLPFRIDLANTQDGVDAYSVVFQKQSGSKGSVLRAEVRYPDHLHPIWQSSENLIPFDHVVRMETDLAFDRYIGVLFSKE